MSLSPSVFTKVVETALAQLREVGIRILNYLDYWLILAHSVDLLCEHRDLVLRHLSHVGLQVNWEKIKLSPYAHDLFSRYGVGASHHCSVRRSWRHGILRVTITLICLFSPWSDFAILRTGLPWSMDWHVVVTMPSEQPGALHAMGTQPLASEQDLNCIGISTA